MTVDSGSKKIKAAIIGCGGRGTEHARAYSHSDEVEIIAVCDPDPAALERITSQFEIGATYPDHKSMLAACQPDIVSSCTWTGLHAEHLLDTLAAGVKTVHAEKPIAPTWGECKKMAAAVKTSGAQVTFCHQRRFGAHYAMAKRLADEGAIGKVSRLEGYCSNMFDWGTHWFDMFNFYNNETPAEWVLGQIDPENAVPVFGVYVESFGSAYIKYANGVAGLLITGEDTGGTCDNRIIGSEGIIEVNVKGGPALRMMRSKGSGWEVPDLTDLIPPHGDTTACILDAIDCMKTGRKPILGVDNAMRATELIFATYESSRKRGRVKLPLEIEDSPLLSMLGV